jgi:tetratricopeptide (TPR) repeat protein
MPGPPPTVGLQTDSPLSRRVAKANDADDDARQAVRSGLAHLAGTAPDAGNPTRRAASAGPAFPLDATAARDQALLYLSALALQQDQADEFLRQVQERFAAWHRSMVDRLVAYAAIEAREPLLSTIEEQAKSGAPDRDLDEFCFMTCDRLLRMVAEPAFYARVEAAQALLLDRLQADPHFRDQILLDRALAQDLQTPAALARRQAAADAFLKGADRRDPAELIDIVRVSARMGDWDTMRAATEALLAMNGLRNRVALRAQLDLLPGVFFPSIRSRTPVPPDLPTFVLKLMRLGYPQGRPVAGPLATSSGGRRAVVLVQNTFPATNRFFTDDQEKMLHTIFSQMAARQMLPAFYAALDQEAKDLGDWRAIYPALVKVHFQWWDGHPDDALASIARLLEQEPSDDFRHMEAAMLIHEERFDEALPVLEAVTTRYGPEFAGTQMTLLHTTLQAGDNDKAKEVADRLLALRLPPRDAVAMVADLRAVGLGDRADEIAAAARPAQRPTRPASASSNTPQARLETALTDAVSGGDDAKVADIARQILNRDVPGTSGPSVMAERNLRLLAMNTLRSIGLLDAYVRDIAQKAAATPSSLRLALQAAEMYNALPDAGLEAQRLRPGPHWLKLRRVGDLFTAYSSADGTAWTKVGETTLALKPHALVGLLVPSTNGVKAAEGTFDQIKLLLPTGGDAPLAGWQQAEVGATGTPGTYVPGAAAGSLTVHGGTGAPPWPARDAGHFVYQALDGDGAIVVRLADLSSQPDKVEIGLMVRESLDPASFGLRLVASRARGLVRWDRAVAQQGEFQAPAWLKLARVGDTVSAFWSGDGEDWLKVFSRDLPLGPNALAGIAGNGGNRNKTADFTWTNLSFADAGPGAPTAEPAAAGQLPTPWKYLEIVPPQPAGSPADPTTAAQRAEIEAIVARAPAAQAATGASGRPDPRLQALVAQVAAAQAANLRQHPESATQSGATWVDGKVVLTVPFGARSLDGNRIVAGFLQRPMAGDGAIAARAEPAKNPGIPGATALDLRANLDLGAPEAQLSIGADGALDFAFATDARARAMESYERAATLSPANPDLARQTVELELRAGRVDAALAAHLRFFRADPAAAMQQAAEMYQNFAHAGRLEEFVQLVEGWKPPPLGAAPSGQDAFGRLSQLGDQLARDQHSPEAARIYRKALAVPSQQTKEQVTISLAQLLLDADQPEAAAAVIEDWFRDDLAVPTAAQLGFTVAQTGSSRRDLFNGMTLDGATITLNDRGNPPRGANSPNGQAGPRGTSSPHRVTYPTSLQLLTRAVDLKGSSARFREIVRAQPFTLPPGRADQINPDRMLDLYLGIHELGPTALAGLQALLAESSEATFRQAENQQFFLILAEELRLAQAGFPGPEAPRLRLELLRRIFEGMDEGDTVLRHAVGLQLVTLAESLVAGGGSAADHATVRAALPSLLADVNLMLDQADYAEVEDLFQQLILEGMAPEAESLVNVVRSDPTAGATPYLALWMQLELAFAKGDSSDDGFLYRFDTRGSGLGLVDLAWELHAEETLSISETQAVVVTSAVVPYVQTGTSGPNGRGGRAGTVAISNRGNLAISRGPRGTLSVITSSGGSIGTVSGRSPSIQLPVRPTGHRIEIEAGPDEENLVPIRTLAHPDTIGHATVMLPADTRAVRAKLLPSIATGTEFDPEDEVVGPVWGFGPERVGQRPVCEDHAHRGAATFFSSSAAQLRGCRNRGRHRRTGRRAGHPPWSPRGRGNVWLGPARGPFRTAADPEEFRLRPRRANPVFDQGVGAHGAAGRAVPFGAAGPARPSRPASGGGARGSAAESTGQPKSAGGAASRAGQRNGGDHSGFAEFAKHPRRLGIGGWSEIHPNQWFHRCRDHHRYQRRLD